MVHTSGEVGINCVELEVLVFETQNSDFFSSGNIPAELTKQTRLIKPESKPN